MTRPRQDIERKGRQHAMRVLLAAVVWLAVVPSLAWATGWLDYELELDDGYAIVRANAFDVMLTHNETVLISHHDFPQIGPITQYAQQQGHALFVQTAGWSPRHLFEGDTFKEVDLTQQFYFIVTGETPAIEGPLNDAAFNAHPLVVASAPLSWGRPKNPHVWRPLLGTLVFVALSIPILYMKYALVTVPVTLLLIGLLVRRRKVRKRSAV